MNCESNNNLTGEYVAKIFRYVYLYENEFIGDRVASDKFIPIGKQPTCGFYKNNKKEFDKMAMIFNKYGIDCKNYCRFFINKVGVKRFPFKGISILTAHNITKYRDYLKVKKDRNNIYNRYIKSINNIVNDTINNNFNSVGDYLIYLVETGMLANYSITGRVSNYFIASIPSFKDRILESNNPILLGEFSKLLNGFEATYQIINNIVVNREKHKMNTIKKLNKLFDERCGK